MKKTIMAIVGIVFVAIVISLSLYIRTQVADTVRITYTFDDNVSRHNSIAISCLEAIDNQDPNWQFTEFKTCGSANQPCVIVGQPRNDAMTTEACQFSIFAPGGLNGNHNPSFTTSKGLASDWALVHVDNTGKTESFVSPRNMQFQFIRNGKVLGNTKVAPVIHAWGANFQAKWNKG